MRIEAIISVIVAVGCLITLFLSRQVAANNLAFNYSRKPRNSHIGKRFTHMYGRKMALKESSLKRLTYSELQQLMKLEENSEAYTSECCPSVVEMVEPVGGRNVENMYVELYRDGDNAQRFYEISCRPDVIGKPCKYIDHRLKPQSRCVQLFSYSYAIVKNTKRPSNVTSSPQHNGSGNHYSKTKREEPAIDTYQNTTSSTSTSSTSSTSSSSSSSSSNGNTNTNTNTSPWALDYIEVRSGCGCRIFSKRLLKMRLKLGDDPTIWQSHIKINKTIGRGV